MRIKYVIYVLVGILVLTVLPGQNFSQELKKEGRYYVAEINKEFDVSKGGALVMEKVRGDVTIKTWTKNKVIIRETRKMDVYTEEEAKAVLKDLSTFYKKEGNRIVVGTDEKYRNYMQSKFEITLPDEFNVDIGTSGGDISVSELKGEVKLKTSGGDIELLQIDGEVNASTSGGDITIEKNTRMVNVRTSGGDIDIVDVEGKVDAKTSGGDIMIKNNRALVNAATSGGDIVLVNIGAEVSARTSGGDISVDGTKGSLEVSTSGGDISLKNIGDVIEARTSGGDIDANNVKNGIKAKTSGGDIEFDDIQGFIEAKTSGGDVEAKMTLTDFSKDHHIEMNSSGGNITLYIPEKLPATIHAEIKLTGSSWRDYNIYSDFSIKIEKSEDEKKRGRRDELIEGHGKINGGGDLIRLSTTNGNINIKKLK